jgi:hypothetical protein
MNISTGWSTLSIRWLRKPARPFRRSRSTGCCGAPPFSSVIIGACNEEQLRQNLGAVGWTLTPDQIANLDAASVVTAPYPHFPYRRQEGFARLNPPAV